MRCLLSLICAALLITQVLGEYGVAHFSDLGESRGKDYCIHFNSHWTPLPQQLQTTSAVEVYDLTPSVLCSDSDIMDGRFPDCVVMVMRGNCTFYEKVRLAQNNGAKGLLIVSKEWLIPPQRNTSQYDEINVPLALISYTDMLDIHMRFRDRKQVVLYSPRDPLVDCSVLVIFLMAVGTVAGGGYWSGVQEIKRRMKEEQSGEREETREETVTMTPVQIALWVGMCCLVLVLLYMYYDYLVYFFIWIFCLTSSVGLYQTLWLLVCRLPVGKCRVPENKLPYLKQRPEVRMLLLGVVCVSVSITWGVFRNDDRWAWVLQDTMGMACCLYMMKILTLPSFRACTLLLVSLLVYDVFFVFITPYITKSGESIMVEVGGGPSDSSSQEKVRLISVRQTAPDGSEGSLPELFCCGSVQSSVFTAGFRRHLYSWSAHSLLPQGGCSSTLISGLLPGLHCGVQCGSGPQLCVCITDAGGSAGSPLPGAVYSAVQPGGGAVALRTQTLLERGCVSAFSCLHGNRHSNTNLHQPGARRM
ncbi:signal peptide peptidase-like 2 isoform X2 [Tachysurus fulvidraco]|uniref:signal peptide peptidase-like 2 isoform X2 n=1 Tax=Tachysurus fulvidraco TaxID=1234273 RepID=UPI001FEE6B5E|nr:signal peptide peptidase-like 2 isoform X2 [Tachysurus fulvidraco]